MNTELGQEPQREEAVAAFDWDEIFVGAHLKSSACAVGYSKTHYMRVKEAHISRTVVTEHIHKVIIGFGASENDIWCRLLQHCMYARTREVLDPDIAARDLRRLVKSK